MRELFEEFLNRLKNDRAFAFDGEINVKLNHLDLLKGIENRKTFEIMMEELSDLYTNDPELERAANKSAVMNFIRRQKVEIYHAIDESREIARFRKDIKENYCSKKESCCQCNIFCIKC